VDWLREFDLNVFRAVNVGWHRAWLDPVFIAITSTGLGQFQVAASLLLLIHRATRRYVLPILVVFVVSGLLNDLVKKLVARDRPSNLSFAVTLEPYRFSSFPSGHSATSFAIAFLILALTWRTKNVWVGWATLAWAVLVGVSRMYMGVHWPTDVIAAAGLGLACACLVAIAMPVEKPLECGASAPLSSEPLRRPRKRRCRP
jgi:undecaprenyl-diphosphatase